MNPHLIPVIRLNGFCWKCVDKRWATLKLFHPYVGKWSKLTNIFWDGLVQPPTRKVDHAESFEGEFHDENDQSFERQPWAEGAGDFPHRGRGKRGRTYVYNVCIYIYIMYIYIYVICIYVYIVPISYLYTHYIYTCTWVYLMYCAYFLPWQTWSMDWYIYLHENHKYQPNVGTHTIHGSYGYRLHYRHFLVV